MKITRRKALKALAAGAVVGSIALPKKRALPCGLKELENPRNLPVFGDIEAMQKSPLRRYVDEYCDDYYCLVWAPRNQAFSYNNALCYGEVVVEAEFEKCGDEGYCILTFCRTTNRTIIFGKCNSDGGVSFVMCDDGKWVRESSEFVNEKDDEIYFLLAREGGGFKEYVNIHYVDLTDEQIKSLVKNKIIIRHRDAWEQESYIINGNALARHVGNVYATLTKGCK